MKIFTRRAEFTVWQNGTIGFLLVDWRPAVLSFFLRGLFVQQDADSSNQRDFFLHSVTFLVLRICPIKSVEYA